MPELTREEWEAKYGPLEEGWTVALGPLQISGLRKPSDEPSEESRPSTEPRRRSALREPASTVRQPE